MATWPAKTNYATGDVLTAAQMNDIGGELNDLYDFAGKAAGKNKIINGDFGIWQRGTSFTPTSATWTFVADRWQVYQGFSAGTTTVSRQAFTAGTAPEAPYEFPYFLRIQTATTNTSGLNFRQLIEDVRTLANQSVTISFWAKASSAISDLQVDLRQNFGSGGSALVDTLTSPFAITTSWVRYTKTLTNPSIAGKTIGTGSALECYFQTPTNLANGISIDFAGIQVEAGDTASQFQTATGTIQGELAACQRYYFRRNADKAFSIFSNFTPAASTSVIRAQFWLPVTMRTTPTSVDYGSNLRVDDGYTSNQTVSTIAVNGTSDTTQTVTLDVTASSATLTAGRVYALQANNSTSTYVGVSAEL